MIPSAYLRFLIFLLAILIPACASFSPAFHVTYLAYKLNKQGDNIQPWCTPFPIWNQSIVPCLIVTVASWPAYGFLRRQVRWYSHVFQIFLQFVVIHIVQGFGIVNEADVSLEFSSFFCYACCIPIKHFFKGAFFLYIIYLLLALFCLHCYTGFSLIAASEGCSSLLCSGFSLQWLLLWWSRALGHAGFSSCGTWAQ